MRAVLYAHCFLVVCISGLAYCEITWELPAVFKWLGTVGIGGWVYTLLIFSSYYFPAHLALETIGRTPAWRCVLLLVVDPLIAFLQFAILAIMLPVRF
jgi:hypothetical protein